MVGFVSKLRFLTVTLLALLVLSNAATAQNAKSRTLDRTEKLLNAVEQGVLNELSDEEKELRADAAKAKGQAMGHAERQAQIRAQDEAMREKARHLSGKINTWATGGKELLEVLTVEEINEAMAESRSIAEYFGLDVERLGKLYELGKTTIKEHEFILPNAMPPDKDESYERYFADFFTFAHNREDELAQYRKEQQEWRLNLFKRVTLAYMRALLASTEPVPPCNKTGPAKTVTINGKTLETFGCKDPVSEKLNAYIQAVQTMASADDDRFAAEAEMVQAQQELATDMMAMIPLVGDAMDYYSLWTGEDLAGRCLTRFDKGLTSFFAVIPFLPSGWGTQAVKRMGLENFMGEINVMMTGLVEYSDEMVAGMAKRFNVTPEQLIWAQENGAWFGNLLMTEISVMPEFPKGKKWLKDTAEKFGLPESTLNKWWDKLNKEITLPGGNYDDLVYITDGVVSKQAAQSLHKPTEGIATEIKNFEALRDGEKLLRDMPEKIREELLERSRKRIAENIEDLPVNRLARSGNPSKVIEESHMVAEHLAAFAKDAEDLDRIIIFRYVNEHATDLIREGRGTKGMHVKGKSADWGPQAGFIPVDQNYSKLGHPDAPRLDKVAESSDKVAECVKSGKCKQTELILSNGDEVVVWKNTPVVKRGDKYYKHGTDELIDVIPTQTKPMMVLAEIHPKTGKLEPITADYDLLGVGAKTDAQMKTMDKISGEGMIDDIERQTKDRLNETGKRVGYEGGNLSHHGAEMNNPYTPGAFDKDPIVTVADPEKGLLQIPVCDRECMKKWCEKTGQCGGLPLCPEKGPKKKCMFIDPDRLLKDYFSDAHLRGYTTLQPNAGWGWGEYNGVAGWSPLVVLDGKKAEPQDWVFGQYMMKIGIKKVKRRAWNAVEEMLMLRAVKQATLEATEQLFSCPGESAGAAQ